MRPHVILLAAAVVAASCGGSKDQPSAPSSSSSAPQPWVLAGQVTDSVSGLPVRDATVTVQGRTPVTTDADGRWSIEGTGNSDARLHTSVTAAGFFPRETFVTWRPAGRRDVALDVMPERAPFSIGFYRYLVRNGLEEPGSLQPVRRWTNNPNFYIRTVNPKTWHAIEPHELAALTDAIRQAVPQLTGGALSVGTIETGEQAREPRLDYINVSIVYEPDENFCGRAFVGANPGEIEMNFDRCSSSCRTSGSKIAPLAVAHEVGHALGFWHVDKGLMAAVISPECQSVQFSEAERVHARIAYRRPTGNTDPDRDPDSYAASTMANVPRIACALKPR